MGHFYAFLQWIIKILSSELLKDPYHISASCSRGLCSWRHNWTGGILVLARHRGYVWSKEREKLSVKVRRTGSREWSCLEYVPVCGVSIMMPNTSSDIREFIKPPQKARKWISQQRQHCAKLRPEQLHYRVTSHNLRTSLRWSQAPTISQIHSHSQSRILSRSRCAVLLNVFVRMNVFLIASRTS